KSFAVQDGQLITGQNPFSVKALTDLLVPQLKH
ncbi:MAG: type 1 glutamine amidotransferase domain-containing protein, partial [Lacticaseibacillus paracasei]|nr:type 1 glutamine amidotransferase domain-containing protein [Lacticaseibacillus paracasei]